MAKPDKIDIHRIVQNEIDDAVLYQDEEHTGFRDTATKYFYGEKFGNEVDNQSQIVSRDVADTVSHIMPSLMRIFASSKDYVQFQPRHPEDEAAAKQASEYVNWIVANQNPGYKIIQNWMHDALVFRLGVVKFFWQEPEFDPPETYDGLTEGGLALLMQDDGVEILEQEIVYAAYGEDEGVDEYGVMPPPPLPPTYSVKIRRRSEHGKCVIENVPPEEFLYSRQARSLEEADFVGHRRMMTISQLIAMGYDRDEIEQYAGGEESNMSEEVTTRFQDLSSGGDSSSVDPSRREVEVVEAYVKIDTTGDGVSELRRFFCVGPSREILEDEAFDALPFATLTPYLIPHRLVGRSITDNTDDLQLIKSTVLRQILDGSYQSTNPRVTAVEGQVNISDLMENRPGNIVRVRAPGMVQPLPVSPVWQATMPLLEYLDQVREMRTGISKASLGLDPDALQSSTATAVSATISAAQSKVEQIARVFAETGFRDLFKGILRLVTQYQDAPQIIRLTNNFVEMDPREWANGFDLIVNVGLGNAQQDQKMALLAQVAGKQEQLLQTLGPSNPVVGINQYVSTLRKMVEAAGFKDAGQFFNDVPQEVAQQMGQQEPQPDPMAQAAMAQVEIAKAKAEADIQIKREKMEADIQLAREKLQMEMQLKQSELENEAKLQGIKLAADIGEQGTNIRSVV